MDDPQPVVPLDALAPGEKFVKEHTPHVVFVKTSRHWATVTWKGKTTDVPFHNSERVIRTDKTNP